MLTTILQPNHDHETNSKHKTHVMNSKTTYVQLWITPSTHLQFVMKNKNEGLDWHQNNLANILINFWYVLQSQDQLEIVFFKKS